MTQTATVQQGHGLHPYRDSQGVCLQGPNDRNTIPLSALAPILVASPHPDDETLGCGGLLARCAAMAYPVTILAMTNGEASHPGDEGWRDRLGSVRRREQLDALATLGLRQPDIVHLDLPDGGLDKAEHEVRMGIAGVVQALLESRRIRTCFVPAVDDCHGDHQETARLVAQAALNHPVEYFFSYQIWPPTVRPSQLSANETDYVHDITDLVAVKRRAIHQHRSQMRPLDTAHTTGFRMPLTLLREKLKNHESYALVHNLSVWAG